MRKTIASMATKARNAATCAAPNAHHLIAAPAVEKHTAARTSCSRALTAERQPRLRHGRTCRHPLRSRDVFREPRALVGCHVPMLDIRQGVQPPFFFNDAATT